MSSSIILPKRGGNRCDPSVKSAGKRQLVKTKFACRSVSGGREHNEDQCYGCDRQYDHMGCTLATAFQVSRRLYDGNMGDCRVYRLHRNKLTRLTRDGTLVQGLVDAGVINVADARKHCWRNIATE